MNETQQMINTIEMTIDGMTQNGCTKTTFHIKKSQLEELKQYCEKKNMMITEVPEHFVNTDNTKCVVSIDWYNRLYNIH